jgi:hypothetical protein
MDYDDGFVAYLNGVEIAREQMGINVLPRFDEAASGQHDALIFQNQAPEKFVVGAPAAI